MYAMLSSTSDNVSASAPSASGTCWVRHMRGPRAQRNESKSTDKLPETAICPSCSFNRSPIIVRLSPRSLRWAATSRGWVPATLKVPEPMDTSWVSLLCRWLGENSGLFTARGGDDSCGVFFGLGDFWGLPFTILKNLD